MDTGQATTTEPTRDGLPGGVRLVEDFINTAELDTGADELGEVPAARAWLRERDLLAPGERLDDAGRAALVEVREALRELTAGNNGEAVDPHAFATLERHAAASPLRVGPDGRHLVPAAPGAHGAIGVLLAAVHDAMVDGTWPRLKTCRERTCRWAFYDQSRNRSGTWCSMASCGNRAKARAFRRRHQD